LQHITAILKQIQLAFWVWYPFDQEVFKSREIVVLVFIID